MKGVALVCGLGFLYFAFASIRNGAVPFKSGYLSNDQETRSVIGARSAAWQQSGYLRCT